MASVALLLAGCVTPEVGPVAGEDPGTGDVSDPGPDTGTGPDAGPDTGSGDGDGAAPGPSSPPPSGDPHGPDGAVPACDDDAAAAIDAVIGDQLAAFAADDYERALELASEDFRSSIDAEQLAGIIEEGYPVAADADSHRTGPCVRPSSTTAEVLVRVTGRDGSRGDLVYRMVDEAPGWRISGAIQVGDGSDDDTVVAAGPVR